MRLQVVSSKFSAACDLPKLQIAILGHSPEVGDGRMTREDRIKQQTIVSLRKTIEQDKAEIRLMEVKIQKFNEHILEVGDFLKKLEKL